MRRGLLFVLVLLLSFSLVVGCSGMEEFEEGEQEEVKQGDYISGELIVSLTENNDSNANVNDISDQQVRTLKAEGFEVVDSLFAAENEEMSSFSNEFKTEAVSNMGFIHLVSYKEDYNSAKEAKEALKSSLKAKGQAIKYIEPNFKVETLDYQADLHQRQQWHYEMINTTDAWQLEEGSTSVSVAVLDTGIDYNHRNLANLVDRDLAVSYIDNTDGIDRHGHGTHVAGTIASYGEVSGVMKETTLVPVKVLGDGGEGSSYAIQQGVLYAADKGLDIVNMSLGGGGYSQAMDDACRTAMEAGTIVIAASGNDSASSISYPAAYSSVIAVGAVGRDRKRAGFSNYGDGLEVMAPGVNIYSTTPNNNYDSFSGTSMAAPHVAGVAGLLRAADGDIGPERVRQILQETAQDGGNINQYGHGIVDAHQALEEVATGSEPQPEPEPEPQPDPEPEPEPEPGSNIYAIQNLYSYDVISRVRERGFWSSRIRIREAEWQEELAQKWEIKNVDGKDYYKIISQASGKVLDVAGSYSGAEVVEKDYDSSAQQYWNIIRLSNGDYAIQNYATGYVLDSRLNSNRIIQYEWHGSDNQQWNIAQIEESSTNNLKEASSFSQQEDVKILPKTQQQLKKAN